MLNKMQREVEFQELSIRRHLGHMQLHWSLKMTDLMKMAHLLLLYMLQICLVFELHQQSGIECLETCAALLIVLQSCKFA